MQRLIDRIGLALVPWIGSLFLRVLRWTMRVKLLRSEIPEAFWREGRNCIFAFWHDRQLMMPFAYKGPGAAVLISRHRDGEWIARTIRFFGFRALRGSTTRGGAMALRGLVAASRAGLDIGITPDGPRGPRHVVQRGVIELAKLTGLPILPVAFSASKKKFSIRGTAS